jgi:hypothetical protein
MPVGGQVLWPRRLSPCRSPRALSLLSHPGGEILQPRDGQRAPFRLFILKDL